MALKAESIFILREIDEILHMFCLVYLRNIDYGDDIHIGVATKASKRKMLLSPVFCFPHHIFFFPHLHFQSYKQRHCENKSHRENVNMKMSYFTFIVCSRFEALRSPFGSTC